MGKIYRRSVRYVDFQIKNDSKLVRWVKLWPIIYDRRNLLFFDSKIQRSIWEYIANNLQSTAKECEKRWTELLEIYEKCKNGSSIIMHDVLFDQLDELLNSVPEDISHNVEVKDILNYDLSQVFEVKEKINENTSLVTSQDHSFVFFTTVDDFEDEFDLEDNFSEFLDEACSLPASKTYKGI